jgi:hypothetical protein
MKTGIQLIAQERKEQIEKHGRTIAMDRKNNKKQQLRIGAKFLLTKDDWTLTDKQDAYFLKPEGWGLEAWFKMFYKDYKSRLIIAGALIAAEIDRIQLIEASGSKTENETPIPEKL